MNRRLLVEKGWHDEVIDRLKIEQKDCPVCKGRGVFGNACEDCAGTGIALKPRQRSDIRRYGLSLIGFLQVNVKQELDDDKIGLDSIPYTGTFDKHYFRHKDLKFIVLTQNQFWLALINLRKHALLPTEDETQRWRATRPR